MGLALLVPPASEPVEIAEAVEHMRLEFYEEATIARLLAAARRHVEHTTGRQLVTATWRLTLDWWPFVVILPRAPVQSIAAVLYDGQAVPADSYATDLAGPRPRLSPISPRSFGPALATGTGSVRIDFVAGYGAPEDVPEDLRQAILMLAAHWNEQREAATPQVVLHDMPHGVDEILMPYVTELL